MADPIEAAVDQLLQGARPEAVLESVSAPALVARLVELLAANHEDDAHAPEPIWESEQDADLGGGWRVYAVAPTSRQSAYLLHEGWHRVGVYSSLRKALQARERIVRQRRRAA